MKESWTEALGLDNLPHVIVANNRDDYFREGRTVTWSYINNSKTLIGQPISTLEQVFKVEL